MSQQQEIEEYLVEANKVRDMSLSEGWAVLKRDCQFTIDGYKKAILAMDKNDPKFDETRLHTLACEKLIAMVEDYEVNRKVMQELYMKSKLQEDFVLADVDNHSPLIEPEA